MKIVVDAKGGRLGTFDGHIIKDTTGTILYWISEDDVFAPLSYAEHDLQTLNKGQFSLVGKYIDGQCLSGKEMIFNIL